MARTRISLGSGLDPVKLLDTVQQLLQSGPLPVLVCQSPEHATAWVHIAPQARAELAEVTLVEVWIITCGVDGPESVMDLESLAKSFAPQTKIETTGSDPFAVLSLPGATSAEVIAELITRILLDIHQVTSPDTIELSLERH